MVGRRTLLLGWYICRGELLNFQGVVSKGVSWGMPINLRQFLRGWNLELHLELGEFFFPDDTLKIAGAFNKYAWNMGKLLEYMEYGEG